MRRQRDRAETGGGTGVLADRERSDNRQEQLHRTRARLPTLLGDTAVPTVHLSLQSILSSSDKISHSHQWNQPMKLSDKIVLCPN